MVQALLSKIAPAAELQAQPTASSSLKRKAPATGVPAVPPSPSKRGKQATTASSNLPSSLASPAKSMESSKDVLTSTLGSFYISDCKKSDEAVSMNISRDERRSYLSGAQDFSISPLPSLHCMSRKGIIETLTGPVNLSADPATADTRQRVLEMRMSSLAIAPPVAWVVQPGLPGQRGLILEPAKSTSLEYSGATTLLKQPNRVSLFTRRLAGSSSGAHHGEGPSKQTEDARWMYMGDYERKVVGKLKKEVFDGQSEMVKEVWAQYIMEQLGTSGENVRVRARVALRMMRMIPLEDQKLARFFVEEETKEILHGNGHQAATNDDVINAFESGEEVRRNSCV